MKIEKDTESAHPARGIIFFLQITARMHYQFLAVACLMAVEVMGRRHLCDDLTLPNCANGDKADYNPTGENRWERGRKIPESYLRKNL